MAPAPENIRGTSALTYHLMINRPDDVDVEVFTLNYNHLSDEKLSEVARKLHVKIHKLQRPQWIESVLHNKVLSIITRSISPYPLHYYITLRDADVLSVLSTKPDGIWIYGEEMSKVSKQFTAFKRVHTFPDCESLYYKRIMECDFVRASRILYLRQRLMYPKFARMEAGMDNSGNIHYHLVGKADVEEFKCINPQAQAHFIRHPHYEIDTTKRIAFHKPIRLLIAGQNNLYMKHDAELMVQALTHQRNFQSYYEITFLGKGWEQHTETLIAAGYAVKHITFAQHYIEEVQRHDIQLVPISIGTGTKGKVLDALANGLLVIGTPYAMENIAVTNGESCLQYKKPEELIKILRGVPYDIAHYENIAEEGRKAIISVHGRACASKELFNLFESMN